MDGRYNRFPRYVVGNTVTRPDSERPKQFKGYKTSDDRKAPVGLSIRYRSKTGRTFLLAPDDPSRLVKITSSDSDLMLFDGRILAQNGWFVVRSILPPRKDR